MMYLMIRGHTETIWTLTSLLAVILQPLTSINMLVLMLLELKCSQLNPKTNPRLNGHSDPARDENSTNIFPRWKREGGNSYPVLTVTSYFIHEKKTAYAEIRTRFLSVR